MKSSFLVSIILVCFALVVSDLGTTETAVSEQLSFLGKVNDMVGRGTITFTIDRELHTQTAHNPSLVIGNLTIEVEHGADKYEFIDAGANLLMFRYLKHCLRAVDDYRPKLQFEQKDESNQEMVLSVSTADPFEDNFNFVLKRAQMPPENRINFLTNKILEMEKHFLKRVETNLAHFDNGARVYYIQHGGNGNVIITLQTGAQEYASGNIYTMLKGIGPISHNSIYRKGYYIGLEKSTRVSLIRIRFPRGTGTNVDRLCDIKVTKFCPIDQEETTIIESKEFIHEGWVQFKVDVVFQFFTFESSYRRMANSRQAVPCEISVEVYSEFGW